MGLLRPLVPRPWQQPDVPQSFSQWYTIPTMYEIKTGAKVRVSDRGLHKGQQYRMKESESKLPHWVANRTRLLVPHGVSVAKANWGALGGRLNCNWHVSSKEWWTGCVKADFWESSTEEQEECKMSGWRKVSTKYWLNISQGQVLCWTEPGSLLGILVTTG